MIELSVTTRTSTGHAFWELTWGVIVVMLMRGSENQNQKLLCNATPQEMVDALNSRGCNVALLIAKKATREMQIHREVSMLHSSQTSREAAYGIILFWVRDKLENELFPIENAQRPKVAFPP